MATEEEPRRVMRSIRNTVRTWWPMSPQEPVSLPNNPQTVIQKQVVTGKRFPKGLFVKIRRMLQAEVHWYVDPIMENQVRFNSEVVAALRDLDRLLKNANDAQDQTRANLLSSFIEVDEEKHMLFQALQSQLESARGQLTEIQGVLKRHETRQVEVDKQFSEAEKRLANLDAMVATRGVEVDKQFSGFQQKFNTESSNVEKRLSDLDSNVTALQRTTNERWEEIDARMQDAQQASIDHLNNLVSGLRTQPVIDYKHPHYINYPVHPGENGFSVNERIVENGFAMRNISAEAKRILDVGCAENYLSIELASLGFSVYGIDFREFGLTHPNFHFVRDDISQTPFRDGFFDVVLAISTIEHVGLGHYGDPEYPEGDVLAMKEIRRIMTKGGRLLMSVPFAGKQTVTWERVYDDQTLRALLKGFRIDEMRYWVKRNQEWLSASRDEAERRQLDEDQKKLQSPPWPCIATIIAIKQ